MERQGGKRKGARRNKIERKNKKENKILWVKSIYAYQQSKQAAFKSKKN
jgi:hypothetical protein